MFDLRKIEKSEDAKPFDFTVDGQKFRFPPTGSCDWHISSHIAEGNFAAAVRLLLGDRDFARFDKLKIDLDDLEALFNAYTESIGTTVGESEGSTRS